MGSIIKLVKLSVQAKQHSKQLQGLLEPEDIKPLQKLKQMAFGKDIEKERYKLELNKEKVTDTDKQIEKLRRLAEESSRNQPDLSKLPKDQIPIEALLNKMDSIKYENEMQNLLTKKDLLSSIEDTNENLNKQSELQQKQIETDVNSREERARKNLKLSGLDDLNNKIGDIMEEFGKDMGILSTVAGMFIKPLIMKFMPVIKIIAKGIGHVINFLKKAMPTVMYATKGFLDKIGITKGDKIQTGTEDKEKAKEKLSDQEERLKKGKTLDSNKIAKYGSEEMARMAEQYNELRKKRGDKNYQ